MLKLVKSEGTRWYVKMFLESDETIQTATINCSDNIIFDRSSGAKVDGNRSKIEVFGRKINFSKPGKSFEISASITDGKAFTFGNQNGYSTLPIPGPSNYNFIQINNYLQEKKTDKAQHPIESWFKEKLWNKLFPNQNFGCYKGSEPYSYEAFINAIRHFPEFASGNIIEQKKEIAAFLGVSLQEVGGKALEDGGKLNFPGLTKTKLGGFSEADWDETPSYKWHLSFSSELSNERSITYDKGYPLKSGQKYFSGGGILQIKYPANYARFSEFYLGDEDILLNNSDKVRTEGELAIASGIFYWMSQIALTPSMHCCFTGKPVNGKDMECFRRITSKGHRRGLAMAISALKGIECGIPADYRVATRVYGYFTFGQAFGLTEEQLLENCFLETADMPKNLNLV